MDGRRSISCFPVRTYGFTWARAWARAWAYARDLLIIDQRPVPLGPSLMVKNDSLLMIGGDPWAL